MKKVIWIIIIVLIALSICGGFYLYNLLDNNKYDLKNISDSQKKEIIEILNCSEISNDIELKEMQVPKAYRDIYYQIYFETKNNDINKYVVTSDIYGRDLKELKNNNYCCTIYRKDDKNIEILERIINKNSDTVSLNDLDKLKQYFEEYSGVQIFLKSNVTLEQTNEFANKLNDLKYLKDVIVVSKEDSYNELKNRIGDTVVSIEQFSAPNKIKAKCYYLDDISLLDENTYFKKIKNAIIEVDTNNIIDNISTAGIIEIYNKEGMEGVEEYIEKNDYLENKEINNENSSEIKIQYNVEFGIINSINNNALTIGYYINDESSLKTISLTNDIKVIDFETEKEINYNEIKRGDYVYINIPTENNNNKQTIISVAKKEYIVKKATEKLIGKKRIDTGIVYYNDKEKYVIANIEIQEKTINNLWTNACYYMRFNILPTTEIYLARTESYKEKSDILLNEMCWIIVDADMISNLNNNYNATTIEFFGD